MNCGVTARLAVVGSRGAEEAVSHLSWLCFFGAVKERTEAINAKLP